MGRKCWILCGRVFAWLFMGFSGAAIIYSFVAAKATTQRLSGNPHVFVHLFEWSWNDVALECEQFLGPKGFQAVLISPPQEHVQGHWWWTRYQPVTYNLTSRSGDEVAFVSMVKRCKASGVAIYADAVINHCAVDSGVGVGGSKFGPRNFPLYAPKDFHHSRDDIMKNCRIVDYRAQNKHEAQYCDLGGRPDLCTACGHVQDTVAAYLNRLAELGVAGIRIDAAKLIDAKELGGILSRVNRSLYIFQEVPGHEWEAIKPSMYWHMGQVTEYGYGTKLGNIIKANGRMPGLEDLVDAKSYRKTFIPTEHAVVFVDNHDTQRGQAGTASLTYKNTKLYDLAVVFMLAHPYGYPLLMSSYHFDGMSQGPPHQPVHGANGELNCGRELPWVCEHRRPHVANMVGWRRAAGKDEISHFLADGGYRILFCRGQSACVALNREDSVWHADFPVSVPSGHYCNIANSTESGCPVIHVGPEGRMRVEIPPWGIVAFHVGALAPQVDPQPLDPPSASRWARLSGKLHGFWQHILGKGPASKASVIV